MSEQKTYTMFIARSHLEDDHVLAQGLTLGQAAKAVLESDGRKPSVMSRDHGNFRAFELSKFDAKMRLKVTVGATVPATQNQALDRDAAQNLIDVQVVARCHEFGDCHILTDEEFARRIRLVAERRRASAIERSIVTDLIDRLLAEGYRITACARWDNPRFRNSRRRDGILKLLFDLEIADLVVSRKGKEFWISLIFGESGWDVIADHSTDLGYLIDPIVKPHLPWNKPGCDERGYAVITLPSAEQLEKGDPAAREAADLFFSKMERIFG